VFAVSEVDERERWYGANVPAAPTGPTAAAAVGTIDMGNHLALVGKVGEVEVVGESPLSRVADHRLLILMLSLIYPSRYDQMRMSFEKFLRKQGLMWIRVEI
jgi:hypothetical protein